MPLAIEQLHRLLEYLDSNLDACDHTTRLTSIFLRAENVTPDPVLGWLAAQGGYCDCEVLANLAALDESLDSRPAGPRMRVPARKTRATRDLKNVAGWDLANLPAPWRIANLHDAREPVQMQLGKKGGCSIQIIESALPAGDQASDAYWSRLWYARTELPVKGSLQVRSGVLDLPPSFRSTLVQSPSWLPVFCWVVPESNAWYLEIRTDLNRRAGDLPQISALIDQLTNHHQ